MTGWTFSFKRDNSTYLDYISFSQFFLLTKVNYDGYYYRHHHRQDKRMAMNKAVQRVIHPLTFIMRKKGVHWTVPMHFPAEDRIIIIILLLPLVKDYCPIFHCLWWILVEVILPLIGQRPYCFVFNVLTDRQERKPMATDLTRRMHWVGFLWLKVVMENSF